MFTTCKSNAFVVKRRRSGLYLFYMRVFLQLTWESIVIAYQEIVNNKLRAFLSLLGITIGIFCIISVMTAVDSLELNIRRSFEKLGDNVMYVEKFSWGEGSKMAWWKYLRRPNPDYQEFVALKERLVDAEGVALLYIKQGKTAKRGQFKTDNAQINAVTFDYNKIKDLQFEEGRYFSYLESQKGTNGAVIGSTIADELFPGQSAVGKTLKVLGTEVRVIGVLRKEGEDLIGLSPDDHITLNYNFVKNFIDMERNVMGTRLAIKAKDGVDEQVLKDEVRIAMRNARGLNPVQEDNFAINEVSMFSSILSSVFASINFAGMFIWIFSILAGGFGIANIMFVSVKERTPLIGIKKSLGAKNIYILIEFLVEAVVLCLIGGAIGLVLVFIGAKMAEYLILKYEEMEFLFPLSLGNITIGLSISAIVGVVFGFIPAFIASRMKPVDAIRSK